MCVETHQFWCTLLAHLSKGKEDIGNKDTWSLWRWQVSILQIFYSKDDQFFGRPTNKIYNAKISGVIEGNNHIETIQGYWLQAGYIAITENPFILHHGPDNTITGLFTNL